MPTSGSAHLGEAIDHLRTNFAWLIQEFVNGELAIWAGSALSRARLPGLDGLIKKLLDGIHARIDPGDPDCPFRERLLGIVPTRLHGNLNDRPSSWPEINVAVHSMRSVRGPSIYGFSGSRGLQQAIVGEGETREQVTPSSRKARPCSEARHPRWSARGEGEKDRLVDRQSNFAHSRTNA
jgi:hypothetical protein